jgi:uncharacterized protein (DUF362 family)
MTYDFPGKGKVAVLKTKPETVLDDIGQVMELAGHREALDKDLDTILKINISWQTWYPACSSNPWQIEGVIRKLQADGYKRLIGAHNNTVVVDAYVGEKNNKHKYVVDKYGVENVHLYEPHIDWIVYEPKAEMMVLHDIYPEGITIPKMFIGKSIIQLPTVKTHVFTTITGAMKNAFGGLLNHRRHWTHAVIHETLVDLLTIQREIHPGVFAVMDGTWITALRTAALTRSTRTHTAASSTTANIHIADREFRCTFICVFLLHYGCFTAGRSHTSRAPGKSNSCKIGLLER